MRLLIFASLATFVITGTAMAGESVGTHAKHHQHLDTNASISEGSIPADTLNNAHETRIQNPRDSGSNPASDFDAAGNVQVN